MPDGGPGHWPGAACKARTGGLCCHVPSPTASLGLDYAVCSPSPRTFARGLPPDKPSWGCPCRRLVLILAHDESKSALPQGTCTPQVRAHAGRTLGAQPDTLRRSNFGFHFITTQNRPAAKCRLATTLDPSNSRALATIAFAKLQIFYDIPRRYPIRRRSKTYSKG